MQRSIGILTFHRTPNDGSVLQTISLWNVLATAFGDHRVKVVDYFRLPAERYLDRRFVKSFVNYYRYRRHPRFQFLESSVCLTRPLHVMNPQAYCDLARLENLRHLVMGSDVIWNASSIEFSRTSFNPFFVPVSDLADGLEQSFFSVSADPVFADGFTSMQLCDLARAITRASFVSYRDRETGDLIRGLTPIARIGHTPDPTVLSWPKFLDVRGSRSRSGPVGVQIGERKISQLVIDALKCARHEVIDLYSHEAFSQRVNRGADDFRKAILGRSELGALVTDRFHGAIIFLQTNPSASKPVAVIRHSSKWRQHRGKLVDLMERLDGRDSIVELSEEPSQAEILGCITTLSSTTTTTARLYESALAARQRAQPLVEQFFSAVERSLA